MFGRSKRKGGGAREGREPKSLKYLSVLKDGEKKMGAPTGGQLGRGIP